MLISRKVVGERILIGRTVHYPSQKLHLLSAGLCASRFWRHHANFKIKLNLEKGLTGCPVQMGRGEGDIFQQVVP